MRPPARKDESRKVVTQDRLYHRAARVPSNLQPAARQDLPSEPSPDRIPRREGLAAVCSGVLGPDPGEGTRYRGVPMAAGERSCQPPHQTPSSPYLEVRAVVVIPVHDLPLLAVPGQHGDHLSPGEVRVELRGKDVDP